MGKVRAVHLVTGWVLFTALGARLYWAFVGNRWSRWNQFIPTTRQRLRLIPYTIGYYLFRHREPPPVAGHNPLAGLAYVLVFGLYFLAIITGLIMRGASADADSTLRSFVSLAPLFGGLYGARWIHHVVMWLLLGFAAVVGVFNGILLGVLAYAPNVGMAVAIHMVVALTISTLAPAFFAGLSLITPPRVRAVGFSVLSLFGIPGIAVILPVIGLVSDAIGLQASMLVMVPVSLAAGFVLASARNMVAEDAAKVREDARAAAEAAVRSEPTGG